MKKQTNIDIEDLVNIRREFLGPDEVFLLGFLNSFNRKINREWEEVGLWDFY